MFAVRLSPSALADSGTSPLGEDLRLRYARPVLEVTIIHATPRFVVIEKPPNFLSVKGKTPEKHDCVEVRVRAMFPQATGPLIVHRLDWETSGLLVLGLDAPAQRDFSMQFEARTVSKTYVALVDGLLPNDAGEIDLPLRVDIDNRPFQIVDFEQGRAARTLYRLLARETDRTRVEFTPITGRTHQLRVHAAFADGSTCWPGHDGDVKSLAQAPPAERKGLNAPIIGDPLYGTGEQNPGQRLCLHATTLEFDDPQTRERLKFRSECPF